METLFMADNHLNEEGNLAFFFPEKRSALFSLGTH
jgi:hypothetical protein